MTILVSEALWRGIVGVMQVLYSIPSSSNGVQDIVMDVILVLPNTTSETSGALNSMVPGGSNHFDNLLLLYKAITNTKYQIYRVYTKTSLKCHK